MPYKHGTYGEFDQSIGSTPTQSDSIGVYVGIAPVNLIRGYAEMNLTNYPVNVKTRNQIGYSADWTKFTLCEAISLHFENTLQNISPIVLINVLDPDTHKKVGETTQQLTFVNGRAEIVSDTIILDTLVLAEKVEGVDFSIDYDYTKGAVIIDSIGETPITGEVQATFSEIDTSMIQDSDIIGGVTAAGVYTGLGCIGLIYPELGLIPNIIAVPGYSQKPDVYKAMISAATKINGHWDAFINADIPIESNDTMEKAIKWKSDNDYTNERSKVYWPKWQLKDGTVYHLSTIATWLMMIVDSGNGGVPMETPSNKQIPNGRQYFGASSTNKGYDQQTSNTLNEAGITTAVYWGGINVLWGGHTAAYKYGSVTDKRQIFDNSIRMMEHVSNSFQQEWALTIDAPMTKALADTIKNREQEKMDALASLGAFIGDPVVEFKETENSTDQLAEGDFVWSFKGTPTPQFKSGTLKVAYTDEGFETFLGGE